MPTYSTGRVAPENLAHLIALSHHRYAGFLNQLKSIAPPPTWDSVALGWVGPVKDQGQCGSCWDFSGTGVCEVAFNKAVIGGGPDKMILSEEYTLSCGQNGGCNGDDNTTVLTWAKSTGLPLTSSYGAYTGSRKKCSWNSGETLYKISDWGFADSNGGQGVTSISDIKAAVIAYGAVGCAIAADDAFMNLDPSKVFMGSGSRDINHDVMIVGWDDTKLNQQGRTAWKLRNSWGDWANSGYCWIADGANQVGTESVFAVAVNPNPPGPAPIPVPNIIVPPTASWYDIPSNTAHIGDGMTARSNFFSGNFTVYPGSKLVSLPSSVKLV